MKKLWIILCFTLVLASSSGFAAPAHHGENMSHDMQKPLKDLSGKDFDIAFYSMMIPHHEGAVKMSQKILETTKDPQIEEWAKSIIDAQSKEIDTMQKSLENMGSLENSLYMSMEADMAGMIEQTKNDRDFVELMIPHHESAIQMADMVKGRTTTPEVIALANSIATTQQDEIEDFRVWLQAHPAK